MWGWGGTVTGETAYLSGAFPLVQSISKAMLKNAYKDCNPFT